jgi:hypothetical protein
MPPLIVWTLGVIGAAAAAKWIMRESRRINAELHAEPAEPDRAEDAPRLRRDRSGVYRPD